MKANAVVYRILERLARFGMFFYHPVFRVTGREHIPEGACVICSNHIGMADPLWAIFGLKQGPFFRIMAKESLLEAPLLGKLLHWAGIIGVKRGEGDINAIKEALKTLKEGKKLLLYPEGTRAKDGPLEGKTGAVMLANRVKCPILPVYIKRKRFPFSPMALVIGEPFEVVTATGKATAEELRSETDRMMDMIYKLGEGVG